MSIPPRKHKWQVVRISPWLPVMILMLWAQTSRSQETVLVTRDMATPDHRILIAKHDGWNFRYGHTLTLNDTLAGSTTWKPLKPSDLRVEQADQDGYVKGWFRLRFRLDASLADEELGILMGTWAAADVFLNGKLIHSFGSTGHSDASYTEYNPYQKLPVAVSLLVGVEHILSVRFTDKVSPFDGSLLQCQKSNAARFIAITTSGYADGFIKKQRRDLITSTSWIVTGTLLSLLFWLMFFLHREEKNLGFFALHSTFSTLSSLGTALSTGATTSFISYCLLDAMWSAFGWMMIGMTAVILAGIFRPRIAGAIKIYFVVMAVFGIIDGFYPNGIARIVAASASLLVFLYFLFTSWRKAHGAQWSVVIGLLSTLVWLVLWAVLRTEALATPILLSFPLSLLIYVALRFKEINQEVHAQAHEVIRLAEEKRNLLATQNEKLEQVVSERTADLQFTIDQLKATQVQLIHSEKMASLGELTAGIAHEIQNPLNFVKNFTEVNSELLSEMKTELGKGNVDEAHAIADMIIENQDKINHHGKRADSIVKGMLQHSRAGSTIKEPTAINLLADECLRLAYHGLRAKEKSFNATLQTDFDPTIGLIHIVPQEIGRVILNVLTNAFYAVSAKKKTADAAYEPTVKITTKQSGNMVEISVTDNGNGIPPTVLEKIFQPFFTTKPTGQGTGLGLSLSYDIVKAHGGELKVDSREAEGATFIIEIPVS